MRHRVGALVGPVAEKMWVSHVPLRLRAHPAARRRPARVPVERSRSTTRPTPCASPATSSATSGSTRSASRRGRCTPPSAPPRTTSSAPAEYAERARTIFERKIADIYREYQARLEKAGAMDFDDLLSVTVAAVPRVPRRARALPRRFQHVLVDEYQDTNRVQNELVLLLARRTATSASWATATSASRRARWSRRPTGRGRSRRSRSATRCSAPDGGNRARSGPTVKRGQAVARHRVHVRAGDGHRWGTPAPHRARRKPRARPPRRLPHAPPRPRLSHRADRRACAATTVAPSKRASSCASTRSTATSSGSSGSATRSPRRRTGRLLRRAYGLPTACFHGVGRKLAMDEALLERLYLELDTASGPSG